MKGSLRDKLEETEAVQEAEEQAAEKEEKKVGIKKVKKNENE